MLQIQIIQDLDEEPISLSEAKSFLGIDYDDFDNLINMLIESSRVASENVTGLAYGPKIVQVTGNRSTDRNSKEYNPAINYTVSATFDDRGDYATTQINRIYPIRPYLSNEDWEDENGNIDYRYNAGYTTLPASLKNAILMRVATGFAYRQNGMAEAVNMAVNASIITERQHVKVLAV